MPNTASGIWYPDNGTAMNINTILATMASSIEDKVQYAIKDSGWYDLTPNITLSGLAGTFQGRRSGNMAEVRGYLAGANIANAASTNFADNLPADIRPTTRTAFGTSYFGSNGTGAVFVRPDGTVAVQHNSGATRDQFHFTVVYMVEPGS